MSNSQWAAFFFCFLRQPRRPKPPSPAAKSGRAAGSGVKAGWETLVSVSDQLIVVPGPPTWLGDNIAKAGCDRPFGPESVPAKVRVIEFVNLLAVNEVNVSEKSPSVLVQLLVSDVEPELPDPYTTGLVKGMEIMETLAAVRCRRPNDRHIHRARTPTRRMCLPKQEAVHGAVTGRVDQQDFTLSSTATGCRCGSRSQPAKPTIIGLRPRLSCIAEFSHSVLAAVPQISKLTILTRRQGVPLSCSCDSQSARVQQGRWQEAAMCPAKVSAPEWLPPMCRPGADR